MDNPQSISPLYRLQPDYEQLPICFLWLLGNLHFYRGYLWGDSITEWREILKKNHNRAHKHEWIHFPVLFFAVESLQLLIKGLSLCLFCALPENHRVPRSYHTPSQKTCFIMPYKTKPAKEVEPRSRDLTSRSRRLKKANNPDKYLLVLTCVYVASCTEYAQISKTVHT